MMRKLNFKIKSRKLNRALGVVIKYDDQSLEQRLNLSELQVKIWNNLCNGYYKIDAMKLTDFEAVLKMVMSYYDLVMKYPNVYVFKELHSIAGINRFRFLLLLSYCGHYYDYNLLKKITFPSTNLRWYRKFRSRLTKLERLLLSRQITSAMKSDYHKYLNVIIY